MSRAMLALPEIASDCFLMPQAKPDRILSLDRGSAWVKECAWPDLRPSVCRACSKERNGTRCGRSAPLISVTTQEAGFDAIRPARTGQAAARRLEHAPRRTTHINCGTLRGQVNPETALMRYRPESSSRPRQGEDATAPIQPARTNPRIFMRPCRLP